MEYLRPIVWPLVDFAFVGTVVVEWMDLVVFAESAMEFVMDVGFESVVEFELGVGFESVVDSVLPLGFVVPHCFESLAARTALCLEELLWR